MKGQNMAKKESSEIIRCANHAWRLFKRGDTFYADGRKHGNGKHSLGTDSRKEAIRELQQLDDAFADDSESFDTSVLLAASTVVTDSNKNPIGIEEGWDLYIERRTIPIHLGGLKPSSIRKYKGHRKRFIKYCRKKGIKYWRDVTREVLEAYATKLDVILAPITIHDDLTMEISVSNWLIKNKFISHDCKIYWKLAKPPGAEQYCYERDEVSRMLELAATIKRYPWMYPLILLLSHTGIRIGSAINLKWADIDTRNEVIHVRDETYKKRVAGEERRLVKNKKSRIIPIHRALLDFVRKHERNSDYFLVGKDGRKRSYSHTLTPFIDHIIKPLTTEFPPPKGELGFKDGRFHSFRHFFVSECFDAGIPECDIKDWVGHSESKIVALYRHIRCESAKAKMSLGNFGAM